MVDKNIKVVFFGLILVVSSFSQGSWIFGGGKQKDLKPLEGRLETYLTARAAQDHKIRDNDISGFTFNHKPSSGRWVYTFASKAEIKQDEARKRHIKAFKEFIKNIPDDRLRAETAALSSSDLNRLVDSLYDKLPQIRDNAESARRNAPSAKRAPVAKVASTERNPLTDAMTPEMVQQAQQYLQERRQEQLDAEFAQQGAENPDREARW